MPAEAASVYQRVYAIVRRIPRGRVCTYGHIAKLGRCSGPRQVGYALHALRDGSNVPWHRVVNARGAISNPGYNGITQRLRLEKEGVRFNAGGVIDLKRYGWPAATRRAAPRRPSAARRRGALRRTRRPANEDTPPRRG